ncbi:phosphoenolpyruvate--protein phosphotransferase [Nitrosomonas supralitoralis]|uniref:Phosphoenolpyruvate-protein phosphotransferase n=1 Tax=Nitrosomonas supralitoralis TaxID=2116706 RepID=A0A2P7NYM7_9PROT|nr:phosphoenolpyruvate--protein phosphotransferase [Nitrosomonas supralitoralis]PSJ18552.1 phosphoenolpyruvate--protein phosphotransferase [Nitrosomonas supralitoralis]
MSFILHGIGVSEGIAIGHAHLADPAALEVVHYLIPKNQVEKEIARLNSAFAVVRKEFGALQQSVADGHARAEFSAFLDLHLMILDDPVLSEATRSMIAQTYCNAEWALKQQMQELLTQFEAIEDAYLRERKADVKQVVERVLKAMLGHPGLLPVATKMSGDSILVAHDLSPADVMQYKQNQFTAFLTDLGSQTSHTAIVARSLNIPSVVALHHAHQLILENDWLIVDGTHGIIIVNPDKYVLDEYRLRQSQFELERKKLQRLKSVAAVTLDGTPIDLYANIELPEDIAQVKESGAAGIGLFRSEFLFLNRDDLPGEEEQFEAYRTVAVKMHKLPVTIRTFDLGADKSLKGSEQVATNPALGLRAIRFSLTEPKMFHKQLRAILRASRYGEVRILVPMLSNVMEIDQTLHYIEYAKQTLRDDKIQFNEHIKIGGMIEIPAAALCLESFMRKLDFLSIGTNDLIQYTLAVDRIDDAVAHLYDPFHPAILWLVSHIIQSANRAKVPVSICGEMAGDKQFTRLLLGIGLQQFSMYPSQLLTVKNQILKSHLPDIIPLAQKIIRTYQPEKMAALLAKLND